MATGIKEYNKKGFLEPGSIRSCSSYHAKIMPGGKAMFRIHDCNAGIRLVNDLNDPTEVREMVTKLRNLANSANGFAGFICRNYMEEGEV